MYTFNPLTEEEIQQSGLVKEGIYTFEVISAVRKTSKSGNPMAELQLNIWDDDGKTHLIYDYLVFSQIPMNIRKVKHFCEAVGLADRYEKGELPEELTGYSGKAAIVTRTGQEIPPERLAGRPALSKYPDKNAVDDYIKSDAATKEIKSNSEEDFISDDIPF